MVTIDSLYHLNHTPIPGSTRTHKTMNEPQKIFKELKEAVMMTFESRNKSIESQDFCHDITTRIAKLEKRKRSRRAKDKVSFYFSVEVILADLMIASNTVESRWTYRPLGNDRFTNEIVKRVTFKRIIYLMEAYGLVERQNGGNHSNPFYTGDKNSSSHHPGLATRFRVTEYLLTIADTYGINISNAQKHYLRALPVNVIKKRASSIIQNRRSAQGRMMSVARSSAVDSLTHEVKLINQYLDKQYLGNVLFGGYCRSFNMGDDPSFNWNKGGRLYFLNNHSYQKEKKQHRLMSMTINNEPIAEVDINASYLSIFYGLTGHSLPEKDDLYQVPGLHRDIVKAWITSAFGQGTFPARWPTTVKAELMAKCILPTGLTMREVGQLVCEAIPVLKHLPTSNITWADLMFKESEAIIGAMVSLRENFNIPAYSMHDGLIVPLSGKDIAANEIMRAFDDLGLECRVKIETQV